MASCGFYDGGYRWGEACVLNCHCEHQCDVITGACDGDCTAGFWGRICHPCRCLDVSEVCNVTTGHCESGCDVRYMGAGCGIVKPSLYKRVNDNIDRG